MILPFPYKPEDWLSIWQTTKTITLLTLGSDVLTFPVDSVDSVEEDNDGNLNAVKVVVVDGSFYISFGEPSEALNNQLVFQINCRDPKKWNWKIPQWYLDKCQTSIKNAP